MTAKARVDPAVYAVMPLCRTFVHHVERDALLRRLTFFQVPQIFRDSLWTWVREGLDAAHCGKPIELMLSAGMDVSLAIGPHFGAKSVTAAELAAMQCSAPRIVLLLWEDPQGRRNCEQYAEAFLRSLMAGAAGNVHLMLEVSLDGMPRSVTMPQCQIIAYTGAMRRDEMQAYVAMRMLDRVGPGSTHLLRALVSEFAGYDPLLAEELIAMPAEELLSLPDSLLGIEMASLPIWDTRSEALGTTALIEGHRMDHTLLLCRESRSAHRQAQSQAQSRLTQLYWRACVRSITPWLEERRQRVLDLISEDLSLHRERSGGALQRLHGAGAKPVDLADDEIDYNTVVVFVRWQGMPKDRTPTMRRVYDLCLCAKQVRDDIAHLRRPEPADVVRLITAMDDLLGDG